MLGSLFLITQRYSAMDFTKDTFRQSTMQCSILSKIIYSHNDMQQGSFAIHGWRVFIQLSEGHPHINKNVEFFNSMYKFCGHIDFVCGGKIGFVSIHDKISTLKIIKKLCHQLRLAVPNSNSELLRMLGKQLKMMNRRPGRYGNPDCTPCSMSMTCDDGSKMCTNCRNMVHPHDTICNRCGDSYHMWKRPVSTMYWDDSVKKYVP